VAISKKWAAGESPAGLSYVLSTLSGKLELDGKPVAVSERRTDGVIGKGGASLKINTFSGDVSLKVQ